MPQRVRAHRAARRVRDGVTVRPFRLPEPSATCRRTAPLCLTLTCSFLFVDAFKHPCVSAGTAVLPPTQSSTTSEESDGKRPHPLQVRGPFVEVLPKQEGAGLCSDSAPQRGGVNEGLCAASPTVCSRCLRAETRQGSTLVFILTQSLRLFTPAQGPGRVVIQRSVRG